MKIRFLCGKSDFLGLSVWFFVSRGWHLCCSTLTGSGEEVWNLQSFGPWGPPPGSPWWPHVPYEHLWIPSPWGWFLPSLVKIQPCISSRSRWTVIFYIGPPPQPVTHMGAIGATLGSATNNLYSSPKKVSTLYTTWLFYLNWIWRRKFEICKVFGPWGPPLGPPIGATFTIWTTLNPRPLRMIPAMFG